jgi:hypothetical protein
MELNDTHSFITTASNFDTLLCNNISNNPNDVRKSDSLSDTLHNTSGIFDVKKNDEKNNDNININIYRYKFTNDFTNELYKFSKVHQYDHRKDFKEAWENWIKNYSDLLDDEIRRLNNLGYHGDVIDKMFKSARYYFRKKNTEKKAPAKRRVYVGSQKDLLEAMDNHIKSNILLSDFKPSDGFDEFCKKNIDILKEQVNILYHAGLIDPIEIKAKIKKTYKNRYFLIINK